MDECLLPEFRNGSPLATTHDISGACVYRKVKNIGDAFLLREQRTVFQVEILVILQVATKKEVGNSHLYADMVQPITPIQLMDEFESIPKLI